MSRSLNINTYPAAERALVSNVFLDALEERGPQRLGPFPTRRAAMGARMGIYGLIGAARKSGTLSEQNNSYRLGISMPFADNPLTPSAFFLSLYSKDKMGGSHSHALGAVEALIASTIGTPPPPSADEGGSALGSATPHLPTFNPEASSNDSPLVIDHVKNEAFLREMGVLKPDEPYLPEEWAPVE